MLIFWNRDKEAVENLLVLNEGQKRRAKLVNDYITRLSCEERLLFNRMLLDRALLEQEINDYDFHMIEELTTLGKKKREKRKIWGFGQN